MTRNKSVAIALAIAGCSSSGGNVPPGAPTITTQPADATVAASFSVVASGTALTYQWQRNDTALSGETGATLTLATTAAADNGAHFRVVVTNSAGSATSNEALLTVTSTSGPSSLTLHTSGGAGQPDPPFLAFQDGDGPWQTLAPNGTGTYSLTVTADRYGVAVGDDTTTPSTVTGYVFQATVSEVPVVDLPFAPVIPPTRYNATATLSKIPDGGSAVLRGCGGATWDESGTITCKVPSGSFDGLALDSDGYYALLRNQPQYVQSNPNAYNNLGSYIFDGLADFRLAHYSLTVHGNVPNSTIRTECGMLLEFGTDKQFAATNAMSLGGVPATADASGDATADLTLLPSGLVESTDVQYAFVHSGKTATAPDVTSQVFYTAFFNASSDMTVTVPDSFPFSGYYEASAQPYPRLAAEWTPTNALPLYELSIAGANGGGGAITWSCFVTGNWLTGTGKSQYAFPDLSAVSGWSNHYELVTGEDYEASVSLSGISTTDLKKANLATFFYYWPTLPLPIYNPAAGESVIVVNKAGGFIPLP